MTSRKGPHPRIDGLEWEPLRDTLSVVTQKITSRGDVFSHLICLERKIQSKTESLVCSCERIGAGQSTTLRKGRSRLA